jgi:hypothetical protein
MCHKKGYFEIIIIDDTSDNEKERIKEHGTNALDLDNEIRGARWSRG